MVSRMRYLRKKAGEYGKSYEISWCTVGCGSDDAGSLLSIAVAGVPCWIEDFGELRLADGDSWCWQLKAVLVCGNNLTVTANGAMLTVEGGAYCGNGLTMTANGVMRTAKGGASFAVTVWWRQRNSLIVTVNRMLLKDYKGRCWGPMKG